MKLFSTILCFGLISYSSFFKFTEKKPEKSLRVFFMSEFNGDSINLSTSVTNNLGLRVTGQESLSDSSNLVYLNMTAQDTVITIRDVVNDYTRSAKYNMNHDYLFIYYKAPKYTFRFSNKILLQEE